ncbi:HEAT repeat domain-containing protein [Gemmata sp.]|uniref:HEAT repeat domain-containing protein n=1 Tax=Gemmata sp. TaxID=1914242 RepID=UPI003F72BA50
MPTAQCRFCQCPLMLDGVPPGGTFNCPRCGGLGRVPHAAVPTAPQPQPFPPPFPPPAQRARSAPAAEPLQLDDAPTPARPAKGKNELLFRIAIPVGYVLFVFVPMSLTIWYFVSRAGDAEREEPKPVAKAAPEPRAAVDSEANRPPVRPRPRPRPEPVPKFKDEPDPLPDPKEPIPVKEPVPPKEPAPVKEPEVPLPTPRDLSAELAALVATAKGPDAAARRQAAAGLAAFLGRGNPDLRRAAAEGLAELKGDAQPALAALRGAETDPDADVQKFAKQALENYAAAGRRGEELAALVAAVKAKEPEDRVKALRKIAALGADGIAATDAVADGLRDREKVVRDAAAEALGAINPDAEAVRMCATGLQARDPKARVDVLKQVAALGPKGKVATPYLIEALADPGEGVQAAALKALERANPALSGPVAVLVRGPMRDRAKAADAIAELGAVAAPVVPLLLATSERPGLGGFEGHYDVFAAVAKIAPADKRFAAAVLAAVGDPNPEFDEAVRARRVAAVAQLDAIDAPPGPKVDALLQGLGDRGTVAAVFPPLVRLAPKDKRVVAAVLAAVAVKNPDSTLALRERRLAALAQLAAVDAPDREKVDALEAALNDKGTLVPVLKALGDYGKQARFTLPVLKEFKAATNEGVRTAAIDAIARIEAAVAEKQ